MLNNILNFIKSKTFVIIVALLFGLAILAGTFAFGVFVGYRKARFSYAWGENYHNNFGGPRGGFLGNFAREFSGRDFIGGHGTFGQIIKIDGSVLTVRGADGVEKIVVISNSTSIERFRTKVQAGDLKDNDSIVVIGEPNADGQIEARFIRVMPAQPASSPMPSR